jgi:YD repeat-containing protein
MPYEVTKRIGERWYRYRVEGYRDPVTRRVKQRWTYLGRLVGESVPDARRERWRGTRERIVAALLQLLEQRDLGFVTIDVIARAAGISRATFYRYFNDKNAALRAALSSVAGEMLTPVFSFDEPISSKDGERERLARWVHALAAVFVRRSRLQRALGASPPLAELRSERCETDVGIAHESLVRYIERLRSAGLIESGAPQLLATGILSIAHGIMKRLVYDRQERLAGALVASGIETICRAMFGSAP